MGKKKNKKKASKGVVHPDPRLTVKQLCVKGSQLLSRGNAGEALSFFKQVEKKAGRNDEIDAYLFNAYLLHQRQLFATGLHTESESLKKQVCEYFPGIDRVSEEQMAFYLKCCSVDEAFHTYQYYISKKGLSPVMERILADLLLEKQCWSNLDAFDGVVPLKRDSETVKKAMPVMEEGQWEQARDMLVSIPRQSPFAPVRLFCRAMAAFYENDDKIFNRAKDLIDDDFILKPLLENLSAAIAEARDDRVRGKVCLHLDCLFEGPLMAKTYARDLLFELKHKNPAGCVDKIKKLAVSVYPNDVDAAIIEILCILGKTFSVKGHLENFLSNLIKKLLPESKADLMSAKFAFLQLEKSLPITGGYLAMLPYEFTDKLERNIAHALILQNTLSAALIRNGRFCHLLFEGRRSWFVYASLLGIESNDSDMMMVEMLRKSIRLDPDSRAGYEMLSKLPNLSKEAKNAVEDILSGMMKRFSDDPYPCLELANLYYGKNAFRKAESMLRVAMERAPHDNRVLDRHALALLISADKNIHRGRFHLSWPDLEKAQQLNRKKHAVILAAKRAIHRNLAENEPMEKAIDLETLDFSTADYLRALAMVMSDWKNNLYEKQAVVLVALTKLFSKEIKKAVSMNSGEIKALLAPIDKQYKVLLPGFSMARLILTYDLKILSRLNDKDFISIIDQTLDHSLYAEFSHELKRRINSATGLKPRVFEFYLTVIRYLNHDIMGSAPFNDIITGASASERRQLEEASHRLAFHADGILQMALQKFEFNMLDPIFPKFEDMEGDPGFVDDIFNPFINNNHDSSDFDIFGLDDDEDDLQYMVDQLEEIIDNGGLRGLPGSMIKDFRNMMRSLPQKRRWFDELADEMRPVADRLSREARIVLYGKG